MKHHKLNEQEKKNQYNEQISNIEQGSFAPLAVPANGGFNKECTKFYGRLAELIASKRNECYSKVSSLVRQKITSFNELHWFMSG